MTTAATTSQTTITVGSDHRIECERLTLRVVALSDYEYFSGLLTDPVVMRYIGVEAGRIPSANEVKAHVQRAVGVWRTRGYGRWSVFDRETGDFVGFSGFRCEDGMPELVSIVHERYWGNGYALEATRLVVEHAFGVMALRRLEADVDPRNLASLRLLDRLGFAREGLLRERWQVDGGTQDSLICGLLERDYVAAMARVAQSGA